MTDIEEINYEHEEAAFPQELFLHILIHVDFQTALQCRKVSTGFEKLANRAVKLSKESSWNLLNFAQWMTKCGVDYEENARGSDYYETIRALLKSGSVLFDPRRSILTKDGNGDPFLKTIEVDMTYGICSKRLNQEKCDTVFCFPKTTRPLCTDKTIKLYVHSVVLCTPVTLEADSLQSKIKDLRKFILLESVPKITNRDQSICVVSRELPLRRNLSEHVRKFFDQTRVWTERKYREFENYPSEGSYATSSSKHFAEEINSSPESNGSPQSKQDEFRTPPPKKQKRK